MRIRFALILSSISFAAISSAQTLPPPPFAGQSYWFGPGPASFTVTGSTQNFGGFAEHTFSGGVYTGTGGGGPAFVSNIDGGVFQSNFNVRTNLVFDPYIYIDGYFGLTANLRGFSPGTVNLGSSKFYVLHNVPITVGSAFGFTNFGYIVGPPLIASYSVEYRDYTNPSNLDVTIPLASNVPFSFSVFSENDEGILEVEISRSVTLVTGIPATSNYTAGGDLFVSSL